MIDNSLPWKQQLGKTAQKLQRWRTQQRWNTASTFALEKELFYSFYAIRKLLEAETKISFNVRDMQTNVSVYVASGNRRADRLHWDKVDELYDSSVSRSKPMSLMEICNKFVHSYVFMPVIDNGLQAVLFNSEREKNLELYELDALKIQRIFERVAQDDIVSMIMVRNPDGEFKVVRASNRLSTADLAIIRESISRDPS